jgi:hypothetical protein
LRARTDLVVVVILAGLGIGWWVLGREEGSESGERLPSPEKVSLRGATPESLPAEDEGTSRLSTLAFQGEATEKGDAEGSAGRANSLLLFGRVVDARRYPRDGVEVLVLRDGNPIGGVRTAGGGRFRIDVGPIQSAEDRFFIHAIDPSGRAAIKGLGAPRGRAEWDAGTLELEPAHDLAVRVLEGGSPVAGARVVCSWDSHVVFERVTDGAGEAVFPQLTATLPWHLHAVSAQGLRGRARVILTHIEPEPIVIDLVRGHDVKVTVVDAVSSEPIAGARVVPWVSAPHSGNVRMVSGNPEPATDAEGVTFVRGILDADWPVHLYVAAPLYRGRRSMHVVDQDVPDVRVALIPAPRRRVSWPVKPGELSVPADGEIIRFRSRDVAKPGCLPHQGHMVGGRLVVDGIEHDRWGALAFDPGGGIALVSALGGAETGPEIAFRRPRKIEVVVRDASHQPVPGFGVVLRNPANALMAPQAVTDAEGRAVFNGLCGRFVHVFVGPAEGLGGHEVARGTIDLTHGDGRLDVQVCDEQVVVLDVSIDDERRLPSTFSLYVDNGHLTSVEEDAERAILRLTVRPHEAAGAMSVTMTSPSLLSLTRPIPSRPLAEETRLPMALLSSTILLIDVIPPPDGAYELSIEGFDKETHTWAFKGHPDWRPKDDRYEVLPLSAGRYRIRETVSGVSNEVDVPNEPGVHQATIDLSVLAWADGHVILPEGVEPEQVRIHTLGTNVASEASVGSDGTFTLRIPVDRVVTVSASHPLCRPHPARGSLALTNSHNDILLELIAGPRARFRIGGPPPISDTLPRVLLFRGQAAGIPQSEHPVISEDGAFTFGAFEPGTYTLWIDLPDHAPLVLPHVTLTDRDTDLGELAFDPGSSLRVDILTSPDDRAPDISVSATHQQDPPYSRSKNSDGESEAVLLGLGRGRFKVLIMMIQGGRRVEHEITVDGTTDVHLVFDAR